MDFFEAFVDEMEKTAEKEKEIPLGWQLAHHVAVPAAVGLGAGALQHPFDRLMNKVLKSKEPAEPYRFSGRTAIPAGVGALIGSLLSRGTLRRALAKRDKAKDEMRKTAKMPSWYRRKGEERAVWGSHPTPTGTTTYGSARKFHGDPDVIFEKATKHYQGKMRAIEIAVQRAKDKAGNASKLNPKLLLPELEHKGGPPPRRFPWAKAGLGGAAGLTALVGGGLLLKELLKKKEAK